MCRDGHVRQGPLQKILDSLTNPLCTINAIMDGYQTFIDSYAVSLFPANSQKKQSPRHIKNTLTTTL